MDPLLDRLKALGLVQGSQVKRVEKDRHNERLEDILKGEEVVNSLGSCYVTTSLYPWGYRHGKVLFEKKGDLSLIAEAGRARGLSGQELSNLLFLDTETTGLAGGTGTFAFLVGLGFFCDDGFILKQYIIRDPTEEPAMLLEVANLFEHFPSMVSFNGKAFDIPLLKGRYILNRLPVPFEDRSHLDLLFLSRKLWKNRLKSRALQDLEGEILEIPRTAEEVPGYMIPEIYFDFLRTGNAGPLKGVVYHNGMDIVSLAALFLHISGSFEQLSGEAGMHPIDYFSIGQIYQDLEMNDLAEKILVDCIEKKSLPKEMSIDALKRVAAINKRNENHENALQFWQKASKQGDIDSSIEIAKYYEHYVRDYVIALRWAEIAGSTLAERGYHNYQDRQNRKEIDKRITRLKQKLEKGIKHVPTKDS